VASGIGDLQGLSFDDHPEAATPCPATAGQTQTDRSFLLLFWKKEPKNFYPFTLNSQIAVQYLGLGFEVFGRAFLDDVAVIADKGTLLSCKRAFRPLHQSPLAQGPQVHSAWQGQSPATPQDARPAFAHPLDASHPEAETLRPADIEPVR
jgi:hypothetical protein